MHKDLSDAQRYLLKGAATNIAEGLHAHDQSLALAREAWINAFDNAAAELGA